MVGGIEKSVGEGGLERYDLSCAAGAARVVRLGAQVTHFQPADQSPVLWVSRASSWEVGKPIRGGVPICFPWFGPKADDAAAPAHGLVRTRLWEVMDQETMDNGSQRISFSTRVDAILATYTITVGAALMLRLEVFNGSPDPFAFEAALHAYLSVGDVRQVRISGLSGVEYIDKVEGMQRSRQAAEPITITGETDRVYLNTDASVQVEDPVLRRTIHVDKTGSQSTVVWNPWIAKAARMADFGDAEWPEMLCIETANVADNTITLPAGRTHAMTATISVW